MVVIWLNKHNWRLMHFGREHGGNHGHSMYQMSRAWGRRGFKTLNTNCHLNWEPKNLHGRLNCQLCPTTWCDFLLYRNPVFSGPHVWLVYFMVGNEVICGGRLSVNYTQQIGARALSYQIFFLLSRSSHLAGHMMTGVGLCGKWLCK